MAESLSFFVGPYPVTGVLGRGGFGTVYLGSHPATGVPVAVKVLDRVAAQDPALHEVLRGQLYAEAAALRAVDDPHCVRVFDVIDQDGVAALVTEFIGGASLRAVLTQTGRLEPRVALGVLRGALQGLVAVHAAGVVHGDVKPDNVLLDEAGVSHLIDFGLAAPPRSTPDPSGSWSGGTPSYLAPEQIRTGVTSTATDLYAVAVMLFEVLVGRKPYTGGSTGEVLHGHVHAPVPDPRGVVPDMGDDLAALCVAGLSKDPAGRPGSAAVFLAWLERAAAARYGAGWAAGAGVVVGGVVGGLVAAGSGAAVPLAGASAAGVGAAAAGGGGGAGASAVSGVAGVGAASGGAGASAGSGLLGSLGGIQTLVAAGVTTAVVATASIAWVATRDDEPPRQQVAAAPEPTAEVVPTMNTDIRRELNLDKATWTDESSGQVVRLRGGTLEIPDSTGFMPTVYTHGSTGPVKKDVFVDLDDDGDLDVVAPLSRSIVEDRSTLWYVWVWDADKSRARQLPHPIAESSAAAVCASGVTSLTADGAAVVVEELLRDPDVACDETRNDTISVTRRVTLDGDVPVLADGPGGYGGVCPLDGSGLTSFAVADGYYDDTSADASTPLVLYSGPQDELVLDDAQFKRYTPVSFGTIAGLLPGWLEVAGWEVVHVLPGSGGSGGRFGAYGDYQPCAWVKLPEAPTLIDYRPAGVVVTGPGDVDQLVEAPADFRSFVLDQVDRGPASPGVEQESCRGPAVQVDVIDGDFASGRVDVACYWGRDQGGSWQLLLGSNGAYRCDELRQASIPPTIVDSPCYDASGEVEEYS